MRRKRLIRPTQSCKINILHDPRRPDKRSASGNLTPVITPQTA
ncbi:phosphopantetheinyl transferase [Escherichia coli]|nr:phosphopantetheinyl transferase [Escherichia coli]AQV67543.1 phosphopantetheinyl transferase [Escherichia coli]ONG16767.1 phosphopantetheinyl transferase [Escherichia coli]OUJ68223.1 phosphopantetheinyl transferase [Escherichia coli]OUK87386.1 phosphopantetheinyl transferase [Escherichia coli]